MSHPPHSSIDIETAAAMEALGSDISEAAIDPVIVHLSGDLAAGKTTLARGYMRGLGYAGAVKSPTFTLVESYELDTRAVHHFDLYRVEDPEELEYIGLDEYFESGADCLVEWPERARGALTLPDLDIHLEVRGGARRALIFAPTEYGEKLLETLNFKRLNT